MTTESRSSTVVDISDGRSEHRLLKQILVHGYDNLKPSPNHTVVIHYICTFVGGENDGEIFDSTRQRCHPFTFTPEQGNVISALIICVLSMNLGETCELVAPPAYTFKNGQMLKFHVELLDIMGEKISLNSSGSARLNLLVHGARSPKPSAGCIVHIAYRQLGPSSTIQKVVHTIGADVPRDMPDSVDLALCYMPQGSLGLLSLFPDNSGDLEHIHQSSSSAVYEIFVESVELGNLVSSDSRETLMSEAENLKAEANVFFHSGDYDRAVSLYREVLLKLQSLLVNEMTSRQSVINLSTSVQLNLALAYLKLNEGQNCVNMCQKVLDNDPRNEKALFRLGEAFLLLGDHVNALKQFRQVLSVNTSNVLAKNRLKLCEEKILCASKQKQRIVCEAAFKRLKQFGLNENSENN